MRIAVTGAGGYLGRPLVEALIADERVDSVTAIDLHPQPARAGVEPVARDIRDPRIADDLAGAEVVYHLAGSVLGRGPDAWSVNVEGSDNVFAASASAGAATLIHASSAAAYGCCPDNPVPLTEECALRPEPDFYYPRTKVEIESRLDRFEAAHPDLRIVRFRPVSTLGPSAPTIFGGRAFTVLSDYDPVVQFTWLDDVITAFVTALETGRGAYNLGAPDPVQASEVPELLGVRAIKAPHRTLRLAARSSSALRLPGAMHPGWVDMLRYPIVVDTARAERELGWRASCDVAGTLRRYGPLMREAA